MKRKDICISDVPSLVSHILKKSKITDIPSVPSSKNKRNTHLECPICYNFFECPIVLPSCGHTFCKSCLLDWQAGKKSNNSDADNDEDEDENENCEKCPVCRVSFEDDNIQNISMSVILSKMVDDILKTDNKNEEDLIEDIQLRCYKAAHSNELNRLRDLIDRYPDIELTYFKNNMTCLYWLCYHNCEDLDLLQLVLDKTEVFQIALQEVLTGNSYSSLAWACAHGMNEDIICDMLNLLKTIELDSSYHSLDVKIEIEENDRRTMLSWLIYHEYENAALLLVELGASVDYFDEETENCLKDLCYYSILSRASNKRAALNPIDITSDNEDDEEEVDEDNDDDDDDDDEDDDDEDDDDEEE